MTYYWEDPVNLPKPVLTSEEREQLLKDALEQIKKDGLISQKGTRAWRAGIRAKKALDEAYGEDRGA